jgi:hypothetical protein
LKEEDSMRRNVEYAASGQAHPEVLADLAALKAADARGELRAYQLRGHRHFRVIREGSQRRVVPADPAPVQHRPCPASPTPAVPSRPQPIDEPRPAAAYPFGVLVNLQGTADARLARLRQAELDIESSRLREKVDRTRRLRRAEDSVYRDTVARFGGAILRAR